MGEFGSFNAVGMMETVKDREKVKIKRKKAGLDKAKTREDLVRIKADMERMRAEEKELRRKLEEAEWLNYQLTAKPEDEDAQWNRLFGLKDDDEEQPKRKLLAVPAPETQPVGSTTAYTTSVYSGVTSNASSDKRRFEKSDALMIQLQDLEKQLKVKEEDYLEKSEALSRLDDYSRYDTISKISSWKVRDEAQEEAERRAEEERIQKEVEEEEKERKREEEKLEERVRQLQSEAQFQRLMKDTSELNLSSSCSSVQADTEEREETMRKAKEEMEKARLTRKHLEEEEERLQMQNKELEEIQKAAAQQDLLRKVHYEREKLMLEQERKRMERVLGTEEKADSPLISSKEGSYNTTTGKKMSENNLQATSSQKDPSHAEPKKTEESDSADDKE